MKKPAIGATTDARFAQSMKETVEILTGRRGDKVVALKSTATTAEIVAKINELILLLQE
jgi:hypothetical protein